MIYTGMMPAECRALTVDNFDMDARLITGVGMKTKVRKASPIVLADFILPVAETLVANARKNGSLFLKDKKIWYANYYEALKAAGCRPLTPYSCRHTTATALAINENIAPQTVQKVMRWANTRMLDRYAHPETSDTLAAVNTMKTYR
jgi:integrase